MVSILTTPNLPPRHSISRARLFINLADQCPFAERDTHEALLEAAVIFCRAALHRLTTRYRKNPDWKTWFDPVRTNPSVEFIREERNWILKEAPPKFGQRIIVGAPFDKAKLLYYYIGDSETTAIDALRVHVDEIERIIRDGEQKFGGTESIRP